MKKTTKKLVSLFLVLALILTTIGAGIGAYFTGTDKKSDTYTIGQIEVELVGEDDLYKAEKLTPNYEYDFTRSVKNIGINDAYVFMAVTIPCEDVYLHNLEGSHIDDAALTQLFTYGANDVAGINGEWKLVTDGKFGDYDIADMAGRLVNYSDEKGALRTNDTATYIYAYVGNGDTLARLAPDAETTALFDIMKFANVSDTEIAHNIENTVGKIKTQVFAIQCDNVLETEHMTGNNADGSEQVNAVWAVVNNALVRTNDIANDKINIPVTAFDKDGNDLNASATIIEGQEADELLDALENQGLANKKDVDLLIDVKSDDFDGLADTTIDVSDVAEEGDTVIILHYNEEKQEWEYITTDTVENGEVGGDFSSYSPVAIIVIPNAGEDDTQNISFKIIGSDGKEITDASCSLQTTASDGTSFFVHSKRGTISTKDNAPIVDGEYEVYEVILPDGTNYNWAREPEKILTQTVTIAGDGVYEIEVDYVTPPITTVYIRYEDGTPLETSLSGQQLRMADKTGALAMYLSQDVDGDDASKFVAASVDGVYTSFTCLGLTFVTESVEVNGDTVLELIVERPVSYNVTFNITNNSSLTTDSFNFKISGTEYTLSNGTTLQLTEGNNYFLQAVEDITINVMSFNVAGDKTIDLIISDPNEVFLTFDTELNVVATDILIMSMSGGPNFRAIDATDGIARFENIPVGTYQVKAMTWSGGDSAVGEFTFDGVTTEYVVVMTAPN